MNRGCVRERRAIFLYCAKIAVAPQDPWKRLDRPTVEALIRQRV